MSFFGKLKNKLFKSSSKLEEGLDAIVQEAPVEDTAPEPPATSEPTPAAASDPVPAAPPVVSDPAPVEPPRAAPSPEPLPESPPALAAIPEKPEPASPPEVIQPPRAEPEAKALEPTAPAQPRPPVAPPQPVQTEPVAPVAEPPKPAPVPVEPVQKTPEIVQEQPDFMQNTPPIVPELPSAPFEETPAPAASPGLIGRLLGRKAAPAAPVIAEPRRVLDDDMLESLEELLISADMGVDTALRVSANIAEGRMGRRLSTREIKELLAQEVARIMEPVARPLPLYPTKPQVVLVVGVNGSGKTTTIGKLASQFRAAGKKVVIAAGDTFRAAAVEQLQVWGDRAGVPVLTAPQGSDPASLAFDAMGRAQADGADLLMIDTAGRLQNRADLMEELSKIVRVIRKKDPDAPHNTLLVLDATTGQNALNQVDTFRKLADVSGLVMTKLDGTAKGGVLVALADKYGLPIHAIGVGEQIDDLSPFDPEEFAAALTGLETG